MTGKYRNQPTVVDGLRFDSKREAARYEALCLMGRAGMIRQLNIHPTYVLVEAFTDARGRKHRALKYEGDFEYFEVDSKLWVVEDVKGVKTAAFKIKEKLLCRQLPPDWEFRVVE